MKRQGTERPSRRTLRPMGVALGLALATVPAAADELPIPVEVQRLDNGLRVVMSPDHATPTVAVAVYYDVGSRVEVEGHSGFAHLFEHMMFEGSANVAKGEHFRLIAARGGSFNGTTNEDRTNYFETLPSNDLALGLFLEADRMRSLAITQDNFENQRQTVMEERRQSYENRPYMVSFLRRDELAFQGYFPYEHSTIGHMEDLQHASLAEVRAFHDRYYAPDNAVVSIAGDFDPAQAMALVRQQFGSIPARHEPPWTPPAYPPQTAERTETVQDPHAQLPAFHLVYHIPQRRTPDHYALDILATVLGTGESSRLYQLLVKQHEIASSIEVGTEDRRGPDLFAFWCILAGNHTGDEARTLIYQQLDDIAHHGITARELEKARNLVRSQYIFGLQRNLDRAERFAEAEMFDGNAALVRTDLDRYLAVTAADVERVAGQYFAPTNRTVLDVLPEHPATPPQPAAPVHPAAATHSPAVTHPTPNHPVAHPAPAHP